MAAQLVVGVPGTWPTRKELVQAVAEQSEGYALFGDLLLEFETKQGLEVDLYEHDSNLARTFALAGRGLISGDVIEAIGHHTFIVYLVGPGGSVEAAHTMMRAASGLLQAGGMAVKVESSGIAHTRNEWLTLTGRADRAALFDAFVALVSNAENVYSCGMQVLGRRDAIVARGSKSSSGAGDLLRTFLLYTLVEQPAIGEGHTLSVRADAPWYRLHEEPCTTYPEGHLFFNPFGMWRLVPN